VTCPFCAAPWVAAALGSALLARPRVTRPVLMVFAAAALSDFLQQSYARLRHPPRAAA